MKKKIVFLSIIISIIVISAFFLYSTYATDPVPSNDSYTITLSGDTSVSVPRFSYKDIIYQIKNTTDGIVNYGVGYSSINSTTKVKVFTDSTDPATGTITENAYKYVKLRIENYSDDMETVTLSTILGYENGGNLIVPSGTTLVSSTTNGTYTMNSATNYNYFYISSLTRANIESIEYVKLSDIPINQTTSNISSDNSVRLWYELNEDTNLYKVYIGSLTGKFKAPSNMHAMFYGLTNTTFLDLSSIDTLNVNNMSNLFYNSQLIEVKISNWDTSNVKNMSKMFMHCSNLLKLDLSNFNTKKVTDMTGMFYGCSKLTNLNLNNFYTDSLIYINNGNAEGMFGTCSSLKELDLSNFYTTNVKSMSVVFYGCRNLTKLKLDNWDFSNIATYSYTFSSVPPSVNITVKDCDQYNLFASKFGSMNGLHTVSNGVCSS